MIKEEKSVVPVGRDRAQPAPRSLLLWGVSVALRLLIFMVICTTQSTTKRSFADAHRYPSEIQRLTSRAYYEGSTSNETRGYHRYGAGHGPGSQRRRDLGGALPGTLRHWADQ